VNRNRNVHAERISDRAKATAKTEDFCKIHLRRRLRKCKLKLQL